MSNVNPKVTAATVATAVTGLILYGLAQIPFVADMDDVTRNLLGVVVLAGVTFAAGYTKSVGGEHRAGAPEVVVRLPDGQVDVARIAAQVADERIDNWRRSEDARRPQA